MCHFVLNLNLKGMFIFQQVEREFVLKFSTIEIYNKCVRDLISTDGTPLGLLDDPEVSIYMLITKGLLV